MKKDTKKSRNLEMAYEFLNPDEEIDIIAGFNNISTKMPRTLGNTTMVYPPDYPYIGMRGPVGEITRIIDESQQEFTTVELATILGIEPFHIVPGDPQTTSILKQTQQHTGKGTLIGIIDTGIDYTNPVLIDDKGETRIQSIWDQTIGTESESEYGYGTIYDQDMINRALQSSDPFSLVPHKDEWGEGTMLAAIAAGAGKYKGITYTGVAPEAGLVVVKVKPASATMQSIYHTKYNPLGFSALDVSLAVQYISNVATKLKQPVSICIPFGGNHGPHDGSDSLSDILGIYATNRGISMVLAAGDEANKGHHASGDLRKNTFQQVTLTIPKGQEGFLIEICADFGDKIEVSLVPPQADPSPISVVNIIVLNEAQTSDLGDGGSVWSSGSRLDAKTGCQRINFRLMTPKAGVWTLSIRGLVVINGTYHIWLPKAGMILPGTTLSPASPFVTISNGSSSQEVITVACYDKRASSPCPMSGRGFTRDNRVKPDFMVAGTNIPAPLPNNQFGYITGTAPASAITAGICALFYQRQIKEKRRENLCNTPMMKTMLIEELNRDETVAYPDRSRGYGLLDIDTFLY